MQIERPELTREFDADQDAARETRGRLLRRAAHRDVYIAGAHLDSPGVGQVIEDGSGYRFIEI